MSDLYLCPQKCDVSATTASKSLIDIYGLRDFANSVARQDPISGAKRKLRKSYKNHIGDLPGRHPIPAGQESKWSLMSLAFMPPSNDAQNIPQSMISHLKIIPGPLPNFDTSQLAAPSPPPSESPAASSDKRDKRKRKESSFGIEKRRKI